MGDRAPVVEGNQLRQILVVRKLYGSLEYDGSYGDDLINCGPPPKPKAEREGFVRGHYFLHAQFYQEERELEDGGVKA
jgi:hypothetical protein